MSNEDIQDRLKREGDNWIERQRAEEAMRKRDDRHVRNVQVVELWARVIFAVAVVAAAVWIVQVMSR